MGIRTARGKALRWLLAGAIECLIFVGFALWLQHFTENSQLLNWPMRHHRLIHWIRQIQPTVIIPTRQEIHPQKLTAPPQPTYRLGSMQRGLDSELVQVEVQRGQLLQTLPNPGSGDGFIRGISVDIPIPDGGGLPATPYRVKLISWGPPGHKMVMPGPPRDYYIWFEGYVNQAGHVVRLGVLQSQLGAPFIHDAETAILRFRFAPLTLHGRHSGFYVVIPVWWRPLGERMPIEHLRHPLFALRTRSDFGWSNELLNSHWVLYPIPGHHPLAVLLAVGSDPILDVAQATAWAILRIEGRFQTRQDRP